MVDFAKIRNRDSDSFDSNQMTHQYTARFQDEIKSEHNSLLLFSGSWAVCKGFSFTTDPKNFKRA
jgi:hypothetical protein